MLARNPSIFAAPLLGAVVAIVLEAFGTNLTGQLGSFGASILTWIANIFYFFAFAIAIIQADALERGMRASFEMSWEEARRKAGGIIVAAIGFWFLFYIAQYVGALLGSAELMIALELLVAFVLIYTIPASAIGGLPGNLALGGSYRAVRANVLGAVLLVIAFLIFFWFVPEILATLITVRLNLAPTEGALIDAFFHALGLGYLAFPFAKQYADVAYRA